MQLQYAHWFFLFYKVRSPTPWMFYFSGLSAMPDLRSLSIVPLRSWGSFWLFDSVVFIGGFNVVGDVDFDFHARYTWGSVLFNSVFHLLFPGLLYPSTAMSCGSIVSFFPFVKGLQSYWRGYFVIAKQYPGKYSTYLLLSLYCDEEGIGGLSSLLSERLYLVAAFTLNYI